MLCVEGGLLKMAKKAEIKSSTEEKPECFIIMPFGGWFDQYYVDIYSTAIVNAGLVPRRADDLYRPGNIVNDIWNSTKNAKIILADLTGKNPNVFYELGLAHAITKPAILVTQSMDDIPFDLRSLRIIEYDKNAPNWGNLLQEKIEKSIKETLKSPKDSIPTTFFNVSKTEKKELSPQDLAMVELKREVAGLKREMRSSKREQIDRIERIESQDAQIIIERMIADGVPNNTIVRRLADLGAPSDWVERRILENIDLRSK